VVIDSGGHQNSPSKTKKIRPDGFPPMACGNDGEVNENSPMFFHDKNDLPLPEYF
jgi:hypothetical protein